MFYYLRNLSAASVEGHPTPWALGKLVPDSIVSKEDYKRWSVDPRTDHLFVSSFEGTSPVVRVGKENPPVKMHGLVVDYDFRSCTDDKLRELIDHPVCEFIPNVGTISFSKGAKLYWEFERPIPVMPGVFLKHFAEKLAKELKLANWLPGFDGGLVAKPDQYYEVGGAPVVIGERKIKHELLAFWVSECLREAQLWPDARRYEIPLEAVKAELDERFPGRWTGTFAVGSRGVRFWDPSADNPTGAQVRMDGMAAYTGDKAFLSWAEIFGGAFVARYAASKMQSLIDTAFYDGKKFYLKEPDDSGGEWREWDKEDFSQILRTDLKFNPVRGKGDTSSEVDQAETMIKRKRKVDYARRLVHFQRGFLIWRGKKLLNMGAPEPIQPAPPFPAPLSWDDGKKYFPLVKGFLDVLFTDKEGNDEFNQRSFLFAWLRRFYMSGLDLAPTQGQVVLLAGPANKGKSFFSEGIVGGLMGGCEDGTDHLVEKSRWTANIAESPVIYVGDATATVNRETTASFSNLIKKYVANATMRMNQKFSKEGDVPWFGRIIISCNLDSESLQILPNMDISIREKVSLFRTSEVQYPFPERRDMEKALVRELPFFARFLLDWNPPDVTKPEVTRFGVAHFHHPELYDAAAQQGLGGMLTEFLHDFVKSDKEAAGDQRIFWRGTAVQLYRVMTELNPQVSNEFKSAKIFQTYLGQLRNRGTLRIEKSMKKPGRPPVWTIYHDLFGEDPL